MQIFSKNSTENLRYRIIQDSDICVRCGLCLTYCPTYSVSNVEMESPRGRIAMAKGLLENEIPLTASAYTHLENCLGCMACEAMCPAKVPYHNLLINTREFILKSSKKNKKKLIPATLSFLLNHLRIIPWLQRGYKLFQISRLDWLLTKIGLSKRLGIANYQHFMPSFKSSVMQVAKFKTFYASKENLGNVALFIGCINQLCDAETIFHAIMILNAMGYNVHVPKQQACCGAIHLHNGSPLQAKQYLKQNAFVFENDRAGQKCFNAILTLASGCNSNLQELNTISEKLQHVPIIDINEFLLTHDTSNLTFNSSNKVLLIHTPCTLKNSMQKAWVLEDIVKKFAITNFKHVKGYGCCGAGGLTMWNNPDMADKIAKPLIEQIIQDDPDYVITANIGCQLHIQKILKQQNSTIRVLHFLNLLKPR